MSLPLIGLALSPYLSAASSSPERINPCCYQEKRCGFFVGINGLYLTSSENNGGLNYQSHQFINQNEFISRMKRFDFNYDWNYGLTIGYDIPCSRNRINLSYTHIKTNNQKTTPASPGAVSIISYIFTNLEASNAINFISNVRLAYELDDADLTWSHECCNLMENFSLTPAAGLRYAKIKRDFTAHNTGFTSSDEELSALDIRAHVRSDYDGIGPLVGLDSRYALCKGLGVVSHFASGLLIGTINSHSALDLNINDSVNANSKFNLPSAQRIITGLEGKLGIDYCYCFCNKSSLTLEAGYYIIKYFDAVDIVRGEIHNPLVSGTTQHITETVSDNLGFNGPYISLTFHV